MEPRESGMGESGIDGLLRRSLAAPVPTLPRDFEQRLLREAGGSSPAIDLYGRIVLGGYGFTSVAVSAFVMRGHGLGWGAIAATVIVPFALVVSASWVRRGSQTAMGDVAK